MLTTDGLEVKEKIVVKSSAPRVQLMAGVSEKTMLKLRRVQEVLSQSRQAPVSLEDALDAMAEVFLKKNDPVEKSKRQVLKKEILSPELRK